MKIDQDDLPRPIAAKVRLREGEPQPVYSRTQMIAFAAGQVLKAERIIQARMEEVMRKSIRFLVGVE